MKNQVIATGNRYISELAIIWLKTDQTRSESTKINDTSFKVWFKKRTGNA